MRSKGEELSKREPRAMLGSMLKTSSLKKLIGKILSRA
jgi:hypothetical protein